MNKKLIISKSVFFIFIVGFITLFKMAFSEANTLIGVTSITAMLMLMERDLTFYFVRNTLGLVAINLIMGIGAYVASLNVLLAIPIHFAIILFLGYHFFFNLRKPIYLPFVLQYLFIIATPIEANELPLRLLSLLVGALCIMLVQLIVNHRKLTKQGIKVLQELCKSLANQNILLQQHKSTIEVTKTIKALTTQLHTMIYERRERSFYLTEEGRIKLNLCTHLEKLSFLLEELAKTDKGRMLLPELMPYFEGLAESLLCPNQLKRLEEYLDKLVMKYEQENTNYLEIVETLLVLDLLLEDLNTLTNLSEKHYNLAKQTETIPANQIKYLFKWQHLNAYSMKFAYAMRLAIGLTFTLTLVQALNIPDGRWIAFSAFSLIVPMYELSRQKAKDRLFATTIGCIIVVVLFSIFKDNTIYTLFIMLAGYISTYLTKYRYTTICVTVSAIGSAALGTGAFNIFSMRRFILVIIGIVIALSVNRFILPYHKEDHIQELKLLFKNTIDEMLLIVTNLAHNKQHDHSIGNLMLITMLIEERIKLNQEILGISSELDLVAEERLLVNTIYELYIWLTHHKMQEKNLDYVLQSLKLIALDASVNLNKIIQDFKNELPHIKDINDKLLLGMIAEVLEGKARIAKSF